MTLQMKSIFLFFLWIMFALPSAAQQSKYIVKFTDKNGTPYSISNPSAFLSQRAITRRTNQGIAITQNDLPVNPGYISSVLATGSVTLLNRSKWFNAITIVTTDPTALTAIQSLPFVSSVSAVQRKISATGDEYDPQPITLDNGSKVEPQAQVSQMLAHDYGTSLNQISMLGGECLHNMGYEGQGMVIAVLDGGFFEVNNLPAFDSLWANNQILGTWDFVANDSSVFEDNAHGEMVLSCMGANMPGQLVGTAPKADYWLLRTEDVGSEYVIEEYNWVAAAEFADSVGADIINSSLGYTTFDDPSQDHSYADMNGNTAVVSIGADIAVSKGIFVVNSAGNSGASSWYYIAAPADGDSVMAVGAVDANGVYTSFSSHGPTSDGQIKPDVAAQGFGTVVAGPFGGIQNQNGTSFSSPVTAGMVACLWQAHPALSARQLYYAIIQSASQYGNPDAELGYGIPDFCAASVVLSGGDASVFAEDNLISVYPNPFRETFDFTFYSDHEQPIAVEMYDVTGRLVAETAFEVSFRSHNTYHVSANDLRNGMYFLVIRTQEKKFVRKVSKL